MSLSMLENNVSILRYKTSHLVSKEQNCSLRYHLLDLCFLVEKETGTAVRLVFVHDYRVMHGQLLFSIIKLLR